MYKKFFPFCIPYTSLIFYILSVSSSTHIFHIIRMFYSGFAVCCSTAQPAILAVASRATPHAQTHLNNCMRERIRERTLHRESTAFYFCPRDMRQQGRLLSCI